MEAAVTLQTGLPALAETARREHELAVQAGESMLLHAIRAGEALLEARAQVEQGRWGRWLEDNFTATSQTAVVYMRIARGRDVVLASGVKTQADAVKLVPALPNGLQNRRPGAEDEEAEAREMRRNGANLRQIAEHFGINYQTAQAWTIPGWRDRRNQRLREERRLARQARQRKATKAALRKAGAAMAELYANCERLQDVLAQARREAANTEAGTSLAAAEEHYREMRDLVALALGASVNHQSEAA